MSLTHKEMMLDTDMCLAYVNNYDLAECRDTLPDDIGFWKGCKEFRDGRGEPLLAENTNCCAWNDEKILFKDGFLTNGTTYEFCGHTLETNVMDGTRWKCCRNIPDKKGSFSGDCDDNHHPMGPGVEHIKTYLDNEPQWLADFQEAWTHATENGFVLTPVTQARRLSVFDSLKSMIGLN